jgi:hypothetical protein
MDAYERDARRLKKQAKERGITVPELKREREQQEQEREQERQRELEEWQKQQEQDAAEADAILDGDTTPDDDAFSDDTPSPPISERPSQGEFVHNSLVSAVEKLDGIVSKPMRVLTAAKISSEVLGRVGQFLLDIVEARKSTKLSEPEISARQLANGGA